MIYPAHCLDSEIGSCEAAPPRKVKNDFEEQVDSILRHFEKGISPVNEERAEFVLEYLDKFLESEQYNVAMEVLRNLISKDLSGWEDEAPLGGEAKHILGYLDQYFKRDRYQIAIGVVQKVAEREFDLDFPFLKRERDMPTTNEGKVNRILEYLDRFPCSDCKKYIRAVRAVQRLAEREINEGRNSKTEDERLAHYESFQHIANAVSDFNYSKPRLEDPDLVIPFNKQWNKYLEVAA